MPKISLEKKEKIQEQIIHYLYSISPDSAFTSKIAKELARDEEFIKSLLTELKSKNIILELRKNSKGIKYSRRQRWLLSEKTFKIYSKYQ